MVQCTASCSQSKCKAAGVCAAEGPSSSCENSDDSDDEHDNVNEEEAERAGDVFAYAGAQAAQQAAQHTQQHEKQANVAMDKQEDLAPYEGAAGTKQLTFPCLARCQYATQVTPEPTNLFTALPKQCSEVSYSGLAACVVHQVCIVR